MEPYTHGVDNSDATVATTFIVAALYFILAILLFVPTVFGLSLRFQPVGKPRSMMAKVEDRYGSYLAAAALFAVSGLFRGLLETLYPHTFQHDDANADRPGNMAGYDAMGRLYEFFYLVGSGSLLLASVRKDTVGVVADRKVLCIAIKLLAVVALLFSISALIVKPGNSDILRGVTLLVVYIPPFVTAVMSLWKHPAPRNIVDGRFFLAAAMAAALVIALWTLAFNEPCSKLNARCNGCPFENELNHNFWARMFWIVHIGLLAKGLLQIGPPPAATEPPAKMVPNPAATPTPTPTPMPAPAPATPAPTTAETDVDATTAPAPTLRREPEPAAAPTGGIRLPGIAGGDGEEDSMLKKMYKLFTKSDSGVVDVADAGLTESEFGATVTVKKLEEILAPIGGLDLSRVDPALTIATGVTIPIGLVFKTLDANGDDRVTATEFVKLLREKAPVAYTSIVEDEVLRKLYDLFSAADSGVVDVADAGLTEWEFSATVTLGRLEEVLAPIGGLNLQRIDAAIATDTPCDVAQIFKALDANGDARVTATEFIKLLKTKVPAAAGDGGTLLQA